MAEGVRGLLAPWVGGAGDDAAPPPTPGIRGLLVPWLGGAGLEATPAATAGARGLLAFWMGGAANGPAIATTSVDGARRRAREIEQDDEEIIRILAAVLPRILR